MEVSSEVALSSARPGVWVAVAALCVVGATAATAEPPRRVGLRLTVSHASHRPGPIDPSATDLHRRLRRELRYESLRVLEKRQLDLNVDEVGGLRLPTGRWVRVRPLHVGKRGMLIAVDIEGRLQTDLRVRNRHQVVIGAERYRDGKLVVTLEPDF